MKEELIEDKIMLAKEEYDDLCANYDKVYEQAKADILGNISDGGTSCHWCIDENRRIGKEEALKQIWHKIEDGDLPEYAGSYLVVCGDESLPEYDVDFYENFWHGKRWVHNEGRVIAWAELPAYRE